MFLSNCLHDGCGAIRGSVVDHKDFGIPAIVFDAADNLSERRSDASFLVESRYYDAIVDVHWVRSRLGKPDGYHIVNFRARKEFEAAKFGLGHTAGKISRIYYSKKGLP
jgi:hypothetical protein